MQCQYVPPAWNILRIMMLIVLIALALGLRTQPASAAPGVPVLRDFEDLPVGTVVFNQYDGVQFLDADNTNFDGTHPVTIIQPTLPSASPAQALRSRFRQSACEFGCGTHLVMRFDESQYRVSLSTGLLSSAPTQTVVLAGFTSDPRCLAPCTSISAGVVGTPIVESVASTLCSTTGPSPITTNVDVADGAARIRYVVLALVSCSDANNLDSGPVNNSGELILDNLLYDRPLRPLARETDPPVVTITSPVNGATVTAAPGQILATVQATVVETALASMTAQVNGHPPVPVTFFHAAGQPYSAMVTIADTDGLIDGPNTVIMQATDFDRPPSTGTASVTFTFHVKPPPPPTQLDIIPTAFEVTQTVDDGPRALSDVYLSQYGFDVPLFDQTLLQNKRTLIRIYAAASGTQTTVFRVPAIMDVDRANCTSDCTVAHGQAPMSGWDRPSGVGPKDIVGLVPHFTNAGLSVAPFGTPDSVPATAVTDLRKSWNFLLPADWTTQDLIVTISVNAGNYSALTPRLPVRECATGVASQCYYNNEVKLRLHFTSPADITINPVYIHVTGTYRGQSYTDIHATEPVNVCETNCG